MHIISHRFLFVLSTAVATNAQLKNLNVDIFYESLCPDSLNFIKDHLASAWNDVGPYVNLRLIPFGKSKSLNNGTRFVCQHGPEECKGNRIQSCVLAQIPDQGLQVHYVDCFMRTFRLANRQDSTSTFAENCAESVGVNFTKVLQECYLTPFGTQLQLSAEEETSQLSPNFIPTIVYNKKYVQALQDQSLENFQGIVCQILKQNHVEACQDVATIT